jgi:transcriptional regulator of arginine metabolism
VHIRHNNLDSAILHHLSQRDIPDQGGLLDLLRADGFDLTVSTLSRHLKKLKVRKEAGRYQPRGPQRPLAPRYTLRKVPPCLLVLKTNPGFAQAMALALDGADLPSLAGTIAGDDTIFAAPTDAALLDRLEGEILQRLGEGF